ncbi:unnamed protein product [Urochloa humidicola]
MLEEMAAIEENKTWELIDPPANCRLIGLKWVRKVKKVKDEHDTVVRHKEHLMATGFMQREGVGFEEVFTPVAMVVSLRLLALACAKLCMGFDKLLRQSTPLDINEFKDKMNKMFYMFDLGLLTYYLNKMERSRIGESKAC